MVLIVGAVTTAQPSSNPHRVHQKLPCISDSGSKQTAPQTNMVFAPPTPSLPCAPPTCAFEVESHGVRLPVNARFTAAPPL